MAGRKIDHTPAGAVSITPQEPRHRPRRIELEDLFQPPLSILNAAGLGVELFGEKGLKEIIQDLNDSVFMKKVV